MIGQIAGIISLLNSGVQLIKNSMDIVTSIRGNTPFSSTTKIAENVYYTNKQEIYDTSKAQQLTILPTPILAQSITPIQSKINEEILVTRPIVTPERLQKIMTSNPKDLLFGITELDSFKNMQEFMKDPTLLPIIFPDKNISYIGWMKKGYAKDYLFLDYKPQQPKSSLFPPSKDGDREIRLISHIYDPSGYPVLKFTCELINLKDIHCKLRLTVERYHSSFRYYEITPKNNYFVKEFVWDSLCLYGDVPIMEATRFNVSIRGYFEYTKNPKQTDIYCSSNEAYLL